MDIAACMSADRGDCMSNAIGTNARWPFMLISILMHRIDAVCI